MNRIIKKVILFVIIFFVIDILLRVIPIVLSNISQSFFSGHLFQFTWVLLFTLTGFIKNTVFNIDLILTFIALFIIINLKNSEKI